MSSALSSSNADLPGAGPSSVSNASILVSSTSIASTLPTSSINPQSEIIALLPFAVVTSRQSPPISSSTAFTPPTPILLNPPPSVTASSLSVSSALSSGDVGSASAAVGASRGASSADVDQAAGLIMTVSIQPSSMSMSPVLPSSTSSILRLGPASSASFPPTSVSMMGSGPSPASVQNTNIFDPGNKLFALGITAVSVGGIFFAILLAFLILRLAGCTKRRRFDKHQPIPTFVEVRDNDSSSSFHNRSMYLPQTYGAADTEKGTRGFDALGFNDGASSRYPAFVPEGTKKAGWDTSHIPPVAAVVGVASTVPPKPPRRQIDSGHTAYEKQFFPSPTAPDLPPNSRALTQPRRTSGDSSASFSVYRYNGTPPPPPLPGHNGIKDSLENGDGSAKDPFFQLGPELKLANPDINTPTLPQPPLPTLPTHIQYTSAITAKGFHPRALRNSTSTMSSFNSTLSSGSAYSTMTRAVIPAMYTFDKPRPAFLGGGATRGGMGDRDSQRSLDVPKDAVSRPGSAAGGNERRM